MSYVCLTSFTGLRRLFLFWNGTCWRVFCRRWLGYPLSLSVFSILSETVLYVSSSEQALRILVSSPLIRLAKVPLGWEELYSKYWNLFVTLKNGFRSNIREVVCLLPL